MYGKRKTFGNLCVRLVSILIFFQLCRCLYVELPKVLGLKKPQAVYLIVRFILKKFV